MSPLTLQPQGMAGVGDKSRHGTGLYEWTARGRIKRRDFALDCPRSPLTG